VTVRVVLADDQRAVREGLELVLRMLPDVEVVGTAANGAQVLGPRGGDAARPGADGPADA
jgi:DNA-binding NarL/FixJ family response regulator